MSQQQVDNITNAAGNGPPTFPFGLVSVPTTMTDVAATQLGQKKYLSTTPYNSGITPSLTGSGTATFIPYQMQDGSWRLRFNATVNTGGGVSTYTFTITGVTFGASDQGLACSNGTSGSIYLSIAVALSGTGDIQVNYSGNFSAAFISGDVALASKPTWAY